jgi:hypothetical protein
MSEDKEIEVIEDGKYEMLVKEFWKVFMFPDLKTKDEKSDS